MKTKNVFLATVAFVFAVGSAFASFFVATPVYVHAIPNQGEGVTCFNTQVSCDGTGSSVCSVTVKLESGTDVIVASNATGTDPRAYKAGCANLQQSEARQDLISPLTGTARPYQIFQ
jgi:hypothetical protein